MAGPGIRYYHMARILAQYHHVTLAIPNPVHPSFSLPFDCFHYTDWESLYVGLKNQDVIIFIGDLAHRFPQLAALDAALVVDGYDPLLAEWLALSLGYTEAQRQAWWPDRMRQLTYQYLIGDFYICASERQRDWWLGLLEANGRLNPDTFQADPSLRNLIDVVPFGLPEDDPVWTKSVIKGVWPGIKLTDKLVLWGGGLWPWLDPLTAIHAMGHIWQHRQDIKLIFPGTRHPNPQMAEMPTHLAAAKELAADYKLLDRGVFFGDWIAYSDWPSALLESDVALSLHLDTLETRLSFRTRILDYIWAGLPVVATRGDETSNIVAHYRLGLVVDYGDVAGVATAIMQAVDPHNEILHNADLTAARQRFHWENALLPLIQFCNEPARAPDRKPSAVHSGNPYYHSAPHEKSTEHPTNTTLKTNDSETPLTTVRFRQPLPSVERPLTFEYNKGFLRKITMLRRLFASSEPEMLKGYKTLPLPTDVQTYDVTDHADVIDLASIEIIKNTPAWLSRAERLMIFTLIFSLRPQRYLEIGTFQGGSALIVSSALDELDSDSRMFCVDPNPQITPENWAKIEHRTTLFTGYSPDILAEVFHKAGDSFDFIFIDGDHTYSGVIRDAEGVMPYVAAGTYLLFHDSFYHDVKRGLADFAARHQDRIVDFGPVTREVTVQHEPRQESVPWGGLHLMQVRV